MGGEWICLGVVDLLGIISFFLLSLVVRKLVVGYLKDTNAGEWLRVCAKRPWAFAGLDRGVYWRSSRGRSWT